MVYNPLIIISGPTGVGKSKLAVELADSVAEIISADSMQVYRYFDIGTAKPEKDLLEKVPHYLISQIDPLKDYNASSFLQDAKKVLKLIYTKNKLPFVVGGTGLYLRALVYGLSKVPGKNEKIRHELNQLKESKGLSYLFKQLKKIDSSYAMKIGTNDPIRIVRALEVYNITGKPFSYFAVNHQKKIKYNVRWIGLEKPREELYKIINLRTEAMYKNGLVEETKSLLSMGYQEGLIRKRGIGYSDIIDYLNKKISIEKAMELTKQKTRNYAKREMTWFRKEKLIKWFNPDNIKEIKNYINDWGKDIGITL